MPLSDIYDALKSDKTKWWTTKEICEFTGLSNPSVGRLCRHIELKNHVYNDIEIKKIKDNFRYLKYKGENKNGK